MTAKPAKTAATKETAAKKPATTKASAKAATTKKSGAPQAAEAKVPEAGPPGDPQRPYGGFMLQRNDHDVRLAKNAVYGGMSRPVILPPIPVPVAVSPSTDPTENRLAIPRFVKSLRDDLWTLGFWIFPRLERNGALPMPEPSDEFDHHTEWAVREFQIAASMPHIVREDMSRVGQPLTEEDRVKGAYLARLSQVENDRRYQGPINGVVTAETADLIRHWIRNHYRCPLVIQAMQMRRGSPVAPVKTNIWLPLEVNTSAPQVYAWDYSGYYTMPPGRSHEAILLGGWTRSKNHPVGGPVTKKWPEAAPTPRSWLGVDWDDITDPRQKSTYKVICAVAERECGGSLDIINAWDNCYGSTGHFHWTMPMKSKGTVRPGEFCGFMSYLERYKPELFQTVFGHFGI